MPSDSNNPYEDNYEEENAGTENTPQETSKPVMEEEISQTEKAFQDYCKNVLDEEILNAKNKSEETKNSFDSNQKIKERKVEELECANKTYNEYGTYCNSISVTLSQDALEFNKRIENLKETDNTLNEKLSVAIAAIKMAKDTLKKVCETAEKLKKNVPDPCHSTQVKIIREEMGNGNLDTTVDNLFSKAHEANNLSKDAFVSSVKVSGINSFKNIDSLIEFGAETEVHVNNFHLDIQQNISNVTTKMAELQEELKSTSTDFAESQHQLQLANLNEKALEVTKEFAVDKSPPSEIDLDKISRKVESTFN